MRVVGEDSRFEVAAQGAFHADACTCQIRGADVSGFQVEYHHFKMDSRAHDAFQISRKNLVAVEIFAKVRAGFFSVNESHANAALEERSQLAEQRNRFAVLFYIDVLDVGGSDPERIADCCDSRNNFGIMFFVGDVLGKSRHNIKYTFNKATASYFIRRSILLQVSLGAIATGCVI